MKHDRTLTKTAARVHASLVRHQQAERANLDRTLVGLAERLALAARHVRQLVVCTDRGWLGARRRILRQERSQIRDLGLELGRVQAWAQHDQDSIPLRHVHDELKQFGREFDRVGLSDGCLCAEADPIQLKGVHLGAFEIQLSLEQVASGDTERALRIRALDPNPAASNEAITHPHVSDERLCTGDAAAALDASLRSGRICDFFLVVQSVLQTYNPGSPYVALEKWHGRSCYECGYTTDPDESHCCTSYCTACSTTSCRGCLSSCSFCDEPLCESCLQTCSQCGQAACPSCLEDSLCPACLEELEDSDEEQENGDDHQPASEQACPAPAA